MIKKTIGFTLLSLLFYVSASAQPGNDLPLKNTIKDSKAQVPPELELNYDQLLTRWGNSVKYADDCDASSNENVSVHDSVYIQRLHSLPTRMEMAYNPLVRSYIDMYAGRRRNQVSYMLGLGKYYFPMFEEALDKEGIPLELKYLPVIESALNPIARSRVGATGLWQFMAPTGRMYNLEINSLVDERRDPVKSTAAAAKYLKDLYAIYGDWNLVIAAYNCGPGNVNKAIRRSGGLTDYWAIYPYLPRETRGYVPIFIAATYIINYHSEHNICPAVCEYPASMDSLSIDKQIHFQQISDVLDIPMEDIRKFNPQFTSDVVPGTYKPYALNLPIKKISAYIEKENQIVNHRSQELLTHRKIAGVDVVGGAKSTTKGGKSHKVKRGDTQSKIAQRYGISVAQLKNWNKLKSNKVSVGRYLIVGLPPAQKKKTPETTTTTQQPILASASTSTAPSTSSPSVSVLSADKVIIQSGKTVEQKEVTYYGVRRGDTWTSIAKRNGVSVNNLKRINNVKKGKLVAGKKLKIEKTVLVQVADTISLNEPELAVVELAPTHTAGLIDSYVKKVEGERSPGSAPATNVSILTGNEHIRSQVDDSRTIYHKVKIGETMTQIASRYNVDRKDIMKWNKLSSNTAKVGQRLMIHLPLVYNNVQ